MDGKKPAKVDPRPTIAPGKMRRDPRIHPKAGDVVQTRKTIRTIIEADERTVLLSSDWGTWCGEHLIIDDEWTIDRWRGIADGAEVVKVSE